MRRSSFTPLVLSVFMTSAMLGCHKHHVHVTAVPLSPWNQCEPEGIPYYLPKPLLVVAKNVRHIDETKVGLTNPVPIPNAFDNQASYADIKANVTVPGSASMAAAAGGSTNLPGQFDSKNPELPNIWEKMTPDGTKRIEDGLTPDSFFTYQIVFVPDLSQKYGLRIKGGPGEVRAAMNLVNGWMYTGMGPYYMKNSSTAQNIMAAGVGAMFAGRGTADVLNEVGELAKVASSGKSERAPVDPNDIVDRYTRLLHALRTESTVEKKMLNYAQINIYEPELQDDGSTAWRLIAEHNFDRQYLQSTTLNADLLKSILTAESSERAQTNSLNLQESQRRTEQAKSERARAEGRSERAPDGVTSGIPGSPQGGGSTLLPTNGGAPAPGAPGTDGASLNELERKMLNLPALPATTVSPSTQVNVDVNSEAEQPRRWHQLFHKKQPPKIQTRSLNSLELNASGGLPPSAEPGPSMEN